MDSLLAETARVLNDASHPLVRAFGPIPAAAGTRGRTLVRCYGCRWLLAF